MQDSIQPGDGLVINEDGLIDFKGNELNIEVKQIDTSAQTVIPSVFIKKSNTVVDHSSHKDYDNIIAQMTADCMNPNYQDINQTIPIPDNYILQKIGSQIVWETISSAQVDELDVLKLYSTNIGYIYFPTSSSSTPNATIISKIPFSDIDNVPSYFIYNGSSKQYILNSDIQSITFSKISDPSSLLSSIQTNNIIYNSDIQSITFSKISDPSSLLSSIQTNNIIYNSNIQSLSTTKLYGNAVGFLKFINGGPGIFDPDIQQYITNSDIQNQTISGAKLELDSVSYQRLQYNSFPTILQNLITLGVSPYNNYFVLSDTTNGLKYQQQISPTSQIAWNTSIIPLIDLQGNVRNANILSIEYSKISNPSQLLDLVQSCTSTPTTNYYLQYNGTNLIFSPVSSVTLNTLLTNLNSQSVVNQNQIQSDSSGNITYFKSVSGVNSFSQVSMTEIIDQSSCLQSLQVYNGILDTYILSCNIQKLNANTSGVTKYLRSVSSSNTWSAIQAADVVMQSGKNGYLLQVNSLSDYIDYIQQSSLSIATSQLTGTIAISQIAGSAAPIKFLTSTNYVQSWTTLQFSNISGLIDILQLPYGSSGQLISSDGTKAVIISQSALALNQSQITFTGNLLNFKNLANPVSNRVLQSDSSGNLSWVTQTSAQFTVTNNTIPYFNSSGTASNLSGTNALPYFNNTSNVSTLSSNANKLIYWDSSGQLTNAVFGTSSYVRMLIQSAGDGFGSITLNGNTNTSCVDGRGNIVNYQQYSATDSTNNSNIYCKATLASAGNYLGFTSSYNYSSSKCGAIGFNQDGEAGWLGASSPSGQMWVFYQSSSSNVFTATSQTWNLRGYFASNGAYTQVSDERCKNKIQECCCNDNIINVLSKQKVRKYNYKDDQNQNIYTGYFAQDLEQNEFFKDCVKSPSETLDQMQDKKFVDQQAIIGCLYHSVVALSKRLVKQEQINEQQAQKIQDLQAEADSVKDKIAFIMSQINK